LSKIYWLPDSYNHAHAAGEIDMSKNKKTYNKKVINKDYRAAKIDMFKNKIVHQQLY
jgi:hypothetical protein